MTELYREERGTGEPILLIHGNGANTLTWGRTFDDLAEGHRVIAYDRRGFGRSPGPLASHLRDHVADAAALLEELEAAPATVLGWSAGGAIALGLAVERPDLVSALVLEEAAYALLLHPTRGGLRFTWRNEVARLRRDPRASAQAVFDYALDYRDGGSQFDRFPVEWRDSMFDSAAAIKAEADHLRTPWPRRKAVAGIGCPVTIITGGRSEPAFEGAARQLARILPAARYVSVPNAGHGVHFDQPERFRGEVLAGLTAAPA
ncbi:MAG TPA: alpha/beta hydrolase [Solirubrobacterales bacterium]|jgi:pimeloyl-ACP methyl ester carboxylesterase|nr:alpha/beta hydrolase [Solirubrobacterales bacterium]